MAASHTETATDDAPTINRRETTANGNRLMLWGIDPEHDSTARSLAGTLPRDMDGLRMVESETPSGVRLWLDALDDEDLRWTEVPDGWTVESLTQHENGWICLHISRTEDDR